MSLCLNNELNELNEFVFLSDLYLSFCLITNPIYHNADYMKKELLLKTEIKIKFSEKNTHNFILIDIFAVE